MRFGGVGQWCGGHGGRGGGMRGRHERRWRHERAFARALAGFLALLAVFALVLAIGS